MKKNKKTFFVSCKLKTKNKKIKSADFHIFCFFTFFYKNYDEKFNKIKYKFKNIDKIIVNQIKNKINKYISDLNYD